MKKNVEIFVNKEDNMFFIHTPHNVGVLENGYWKKRKYELSEDEDVLNIIEKNLKGFFPIHHPFNGNMQEKFLCPVCRYNLLYITMYARLRTHDEHVSNPNGTASNKPVYQCLNQNCDAFKNGLGWDYYGGLYQMRGFNKDFNVKFINNNDAPFGSIFRKSNIEIYKKDENFTLFTLNKWRVDICYKYKADTNGTILKRKRYIQILRKDDKIGAWVYHTLGIKMLFFSIRNFNLNIKNKKEITCWELRENADWWRKVAAVYLKLRHPKDVTFEKEVHPDMFKRSRLISFVEKYIK